MIDRKEFAEELMLREQIRKAIHIIVGKRRQQRLNEQREEKELRSILRSIILEKANTVATGAIHDNTGINTLEDMLKNTNILSVLSKGYKSLTTAKEQRTSYRNHILNAVEMSLAPEESRKESDEEITDVETEEEIELEEAIDIDIDSDPEDDPAFISVEDEEPKSDAEIEQEEFTISGEDMTGRNKAFTDFKNIEKNILVPFDDLDNPEDRAMFEEYLLKNLALYFDKFEDEMPANVEPPAEAGEAVADEPEGGDEFDVEGEETELELQEVLQMDLENLIECLK